MQTLKSFLCFKLETGGLVIGWFTFTCNLLWIVLSQLGILLLTIYECDELAGLFSEMEKVFNHTRKDRKGCDRGLFIGILVVIAMFCTGFSVIGYRAIQGVKARDHIRVKPIMILYAVSTILSLFPLFSLSFVGVIVGLLHTAILAYIYVVIYSVYDLLRREYESAFGRQNQEARKALNEI